MNLLQMLWQHFESHAHTNSNKLQRTEAIWAHLCEEWAKTPPQQCQRIVK